MPRAFIGCPLCKDAERPISRKSICVRGKMKKPPTTNAMIADLGDCQVARTADRNQTRLDTNCPGKPPKKTLRTSRWASLIFTVVPFRNQNSHWALVCIREYETVGESYH